MFALPAASVPPISVTRTSRSEGSPRWASSMVGTVVTRSSSMIRGLVSATSPRAIVPAGRRPPGGVPRWSSWGSAAAEVTPRPRSSRRVRGVRASVPAGLGGWGGPSRRDGRGRFGGAGRGRFGGGLGLGFYRRLPGHRGVGHRPLQTRGRVTRDELRLGVQDVQRARHHDEQEHREGEGQYRAAEGPRADVGIHSRSPLPLMSLLQSVEQEPEQQGHQGHVCPDGREGAQ